MKKLNIYKKQTSKPFIVAEMSANHNQSLKTALQIVDKAAKSGAHAIKIQTFLPEKMTLNIKKNQFLIKDKQSLWKGKYLYDLYLKAHTPFDWHLPIFKKAKSLGLTCFSSVFDEESVDFLESLKVPAYKIASFENNHFPLIEKVAKTKKPLMISTGLANYRNLDEIIKILKKNNHNNFCFLKCTSTYPADPSDSNLLCIPEMIKRYNCPVGLSDHTIGYSTAIASIALGARIIEKHFKLNNNDRGLDSKFSLNPIKFKTYVDNINLSWLSLGKKKLEISKNEKKSKIFKRSIFISKDIKKGSKFSKENLTIIRPGYGLHPKYFFKLIGKKAKKNHTRGTPTKVNMLK